MIAGENNTILDSLKQSESEVDSLWVEMKSEKKERKFIAKKAIESEDAITSNKRVFERKERAFDGDKPKTYSPLDLINAWIDSEHDEFIYNCKQKFLQMTLKSLKNNDYSDVHHVYDFAEYLSEKSKGFVRTVVRHFDSKQNKIATLYDWNSGIENNDRVRSHVYIATVDSVNDEWLQSRRETFDSIYNNNLDEAGSLTSRGYSIIRRYCQQDMINSFMKLHFFIDYEFAKAFIIHSVSGRVNFTSKKTEEESV